MAERTRPGPLAVREVGARQGLDRGPGRRVVGDQEAVGIDGQVPHGARRREHADGARVGKDVADAVGRVLGVDGQIGRTGLHDGQQGDRQLHRPRQGHRHIVLGPDTAGQQPARQPVRPGVQLRVRQTRGAADHRIGVRRQRDLGLEEFPQTRRGHLTCRVVPLGRHAQELSRVHGRKLPARQI